MDLGIDISQKLFPNPLTMLYTLCVTAVLFFFIYKFLFNPAREMIQKREDYVNGKLKDDNNINLEAKENLSKAKEEVEKAKVLSKDIIETAKKEAKDTKAVIVDDAKTEAQDIYRKAHDRIKKEEMELKKDINRQIVDVALSASEKLLKDKDLSKQDEDSLNEIIDELNGK